jgi:hypothetical protein
VVAVAHTLQETHIPVPVEHILEHPGLDNKYNLIPEVVVYLKVRFDMVVDYSQM